MKYFEIQCRDPIVARDGRPFDSGGKMRATTWLVPSVLAGSFRTLLGKKIDSTFSGDLPDRLKKVSVHGFFPMAENKLYFPKPEDCIAKPNQNNKDLKKEDPILLQTKPQTCHPDQGCDLPPGNLLPVMLTSEQSKADFKPAAVPEWWPADAFENWLINEEVALNETFLRKPEEDQRTHLEVEETSGTAEDGMVFTTTSLSLEALPSYGIERKHTQVSYPIRVEAEGDLHNHCNNLDQKHPLGGERRLVHWREANQQSKLWECPKKVSDALTKNPKNVRLILATPSIFKDGWKPAWLTLKDGFLQGNPPGSGVTLKLVGASIARWKAVSGWSLAKPYGPKPTRRMVPAGSVYFFECITGNPADLTNHWLKSVADEEQDQRDGFGLSLWGIW